MGKKAAPVRVIVSLVVIAIIAVGFATNAGIGTISAFGWSDISLLCPLGALGTMLASKLLVPRALIALVIAVVLIIIFGRAFCAWACPVPLLQRLRNIFKKPESKTEGLPTPGGEAPLVKEPLSANGSDAPEALVADAVVMEAREAKDAKKEAACPGNCGSCAEKRSKIDSRHFILGGSLLSAAVFGFPVFCLVCPIGLSFALILLVMRLFGGGDVTWSLVIVPLVLFVELVLFRKWCSKLCPLSAFMSLLGLLNKTFKPRIDDSRCIETAQGASCGICGKVCPEGIDPRHPELSEAGMNECTKCRECAVSCPTKALTLPLLPKK
ncbi:MAG: 4Fe-4S binding protein [Coriobacteriaceae bacterium]|jgi:ferredoxin-type protein NapH|nr:4Fe-4S binding protein [Coriobacteriaceae bacterium]